MSEKTLVLEIQELYQVIPECKQLEGKNFSGIKELLINLVEAIEASGDWEFIQYINNKPSLFVIRKVQTGSRFESKKFHEFQHMFDTIQRMYDKIVSPGKDPSHWDHPLNSDHHYNQPKESYYNDHVQEEKKPESILQTEEMVETKNEIQKNLNDTYIPSVKLPWEE